MKRKSPRSDWVLWTPDSNAHEALGYRLTFVRSEVSATDSNSLISDGRVHIVYKYVEGLSRLKQKCTKCKLLPNPRGVPWKIETFFVNEFYDDYFLKKAFIIIIY